MDVLIKIILRLDKVYHTERYDFKAKRIHTRAVSILNNHISDCLAVFGNLIEIQTGIREKKIINVL